MRACSLRVKDQAGASAPPRKASLFASVSLASIPRRPPTNGAPSLSPSSMNEDIHFERRGGSSFAHLRQVRPGKARGRRRRRRCRGALCCGRGMARVWGWRRRRWRSIHRRRSVRSCTMMATRPPIMTRPWKRSVHTTARKPPCNENLRSDD